MNELIQKLREIAAGENPPDTSCGLCFFLDKTGFHDIDPVLQKSYESWPHYSGDVAYPVPSLEAEWTPKAMYWATSNKWIGPYGDLRRDLCRHFADYLESLNEAS